MKVYETEIKHKYFEDFFSALEHGTIMRTEIRCKRIFCYIRDSTCRWLIVEKVKMFCCYVKHF